MREEKIIETVSKNLKKLRKDLKLTQEQFAKKIGVTKTSISNYEKGRNLFPLEKLPAVIKALDCSVNDLFFPIFDMSVDQEIFELVKKIRNVFKHEDLKDVLNDFLKGLEIYELGIKQKKSEADRKARGYPDLG
jgi:transcriptional regulator with XRE-family HTH domain